MPIPFSMSIDSFLFMGVFMSNGCGHTVCAGVPQISQIYTDGHTVSMEFYGWVFHAGFADNSVRQESVFICVITINKNRHPPLEEYGALPCCHAFALVL